MRKRTQAVLTGMITIFSILLFFGGTIQGAQGEKYPTKPIEILVPYPPGSAVDFMSRLIADVGPKYLKQPIVVINKPGANGSIAAAEVLSSKPDGYKLLMASNFFVATTVKTQKVPFDADDLDPISCFFAYKQGLVVRSDSPWKTLSELVEYARKNPNKLKVGITGRGTTQHLPVMLIFKDAEIIEIPTKGSAERIPALLGGHIDAGVMTFQPVKSHIRAGKLRLLVFFSDQRFSDLPDVPSALELGYPQVAKLNTFNGLYIHKGTPEEIKKLLVGAFKKIDEDPQFKKGLGNFAEDPRFGGPEYFKKTIEDAKEVGIPLIKKLGLYIEH
jgi:tripartite-type tricarboxylate transporter receptor subunit TctC